MIPVFLINLYSTAIIVISYLIVCYSIADCLTALLLQFELFDWHYNYFHSYNYVNDWKVLPVVGTYDTKATAVVI